MFLDPRAEFSGAEFAALEFARETLFNPGSVLSADASASAAFSGGLARPSTLTASGSVTGFEHLHRVLTLESQRRVEAGWSRANYRDLHREFSLACRPSLITRSATRHPKIRMPSDQSNRGERPCLNAKMSPPMHANALAIT